jgi:hypothetical protein
MSEFKVIRSQSKVKALAACVCLTVVLAGCAGLKEKARGFAGVSTKTLQDNRLSAVSKVIPMAGDACYGRAKAALEFMKAYIYAQDAGKTMIAVYVSEQDTTPVGIFFKPIDPSATQIEVSSPSTPARDYIAAQLFASFEETPTLEPKLQERSIPGDAQSP